MRKILPLFLILTVLSGGKICKAQNQNKIDSLLKVLKIAREDTNKVNTLNDLAFQYYSMNPDSGILLGNEALSLSRKINFRRGESNANHSLGADYWAKGDYQEALKHHLKALSIREEMKDTNGTIKSLGNIGLVYFEQSNYPKALDYYFKVLKLAESLKNKQIQAKTFGNVGNVYWRQGDNHKALDYYLKALKILEELDNKQGIVTDLGNIANVYLKENDYSKALEYYFKAVRMAEELGDRKFIAQQFGNIGATYMHQKKYSNAEEYFSNALKMAEEFGDKNGIAQNLCNIGSLNIRIKKFADAEKYIKHSLAVSDSIGWLECSRDNNLNLNEVYESTGRIGLALEYYKKYIIIRDSLSNEENIKKQTQLEMNYDFEKKEAITKAETDKKQALAAAEINRQKLIRNSTFGGVGIAAIFSFLLIRSFNKRRKTSFEKQVSEVEMKALRSQMNPHFIFNALQSVNDFILKKDIENASNFVIKFAKLMRAVLENSIHKEVSLEKDIASLELYMQLESSRFKHPFEYEIVVDPKIDQEATLIPPLILQPFVENSIWHGLKHKKEKGKIRIEIKEENNSIVCSIEDNGVGREKANTLKEPVAEKKESLGMKLTKERLKILEQIKNFKSKIDTIDLKDAMNNPLGFRVELSLPLTTLN